MKPRAARATSHLLVDDVAIPLLPSLACLLGERKAIVLQQIHFLSSGKSDRRCVAEIDGHNYAFKSRREWRRDEFPWMSLHAIDRVFADLTEAGLLRVCRLSGHGGENGYAINHEALAALCNANPTAAVEPCTEEAEARETLFDRVERQAREEQETGAPAEGGGLDIATLEIRNARAANSLGSGGGRESAKGSAPARGGGRESAGESSAPALTPPQRPRDDCSQKRDSLYREESETKREIRGEFIPAAAAQARATHSVAIERSAAAGFQTWGMGQAATADSPELHAPRASRSIATISPGSTGAPKSAATAAAITTPEQILAASVLTEAGFDAGDAIDLVRAHGATAEQVRHLFDAARRLSQAGTLRSTIRGFVVAGLRRGDRPQPTPAQLAKAIRPRRDADGHRLQRERDEASKSEFERALAAATAVLDALPPGDLAALTTHTLQRCSQHVAAHVTRRGGDPRASHILVMAMADDWRNGWRPPVPRAVAPPLETVG